MKTIDRYKHFGAWYQQSRELIRKRYGRNANLFSRLLAATSPRKRVRANWNLADRILTDVLSGRAIDYTGTMPCHRPNIDNAINGRELSGPKVRAFARNLTGDYNAVTVDVWILKYFNKKIASPKIYQELSDRITRLAERYGLRPAEMQAIIWSIVRDRHGRSPRGFYQDGYQTEFEFGGSVK